MTRKLASYVAGSSPAALPPSPMSLPGVNQLAHFIAESQRLQPRGAVINVVDAAIADLVTRTIELVAGAQRTSCDIKFVAGFSKILIDIAFRLTKCGFQYQIVLKSYFAPSEWR